MIVSFHGTKFASTAREHIPQKEVAQKINCFTWKGNDFMLSLWAERHCSTLEPDRGSFKADVVERLRTLSTLETHSFARDPRQTLVLRQSISRYAVCVSDRR